jgi:hypothetical protein
MSIYNSEAYLQNTTNIPITLGNVTISSNGSLLFWNTKNFTDTNDIFDNLIQNKVELDTNLEDGYLLFIHDGIQLTYTQSLYVFDDMKNAYEKSNSISSMLSVKTQVVKTDSLKEIDGRQIVTTSPIGIGWNIYFTGYDDDNDQFVIHKLNPFAPSGRGDGNPFLVEVLGEDEDPTIVEFSFCEPLHIHDGEMNWGPDGYWDYHDRFSIGIKFSPSLVEITPGTGNCNLINVITQDVMFNNDGYAIIIPAAGNGYFTVDLDTACPIRNAKKNGYWEVNEETGIISMGEPGASAFDLYNFAPANAWLMKNIATANYRNIMEPEVYRTELIHPSWKIIISVTKITPGIGWLTGWFTCFRKNVQ